MNKKPVSPLAQALRESFGKSCHTKKGTVIHAYNKELKAEQRDAGFTDAQWSEYFRLQSAKFAGRQQVLPMLGRGVRMSRSGHIDLIWWDEISSPEFDPQLVREFTERYMVAGAQTDVRYVDPHQLWNDGLRAAADMSEAEREEYLNGNWNLEGM